MTTITLRTRNSFYIKEKGVRIKLKNKIKTETLCSMRIPFIDESYNIPKQGKLSFSVMFAVNTIAFLSSQNHQDVSNEMKQIAESSLIHNLESI